MTEERIQEIYDNGAELTTEELAVYLDNTLELNGRPEDDTVRLQLTGIRLPCWVKYADSVPKAIINVTAELFDWKLEHRSENSWYLHPWGK